MEKRKKILIIDDERDFCMITKMNLEVLGRFDVIIANKGEEGLRLAKKQRPDLIILDINMPGMNGLEVLAKIKKDEQILHLPVIMLSANEDDASKLNATKLYTDMYLTKPIEAKELIAKIDGILKLTPRF